MESGQFKTGKDKHDTFLCMLQENIRITPSIANAVAEKYPNVNRLVEAMEEIGPSALEKLKVYLDVKFFFMGLVKLTLFNLRKMEKAPKEILARSSARGYIRSLWTWTP